MKKCTYCGRENNDASVLCSECGVELVGPPKAESDPLTDPALTLVIVSTFSSLQEATLLVHRLEASGIEACIPEEYSPQVFSAVIPLERLTVRVAAKDYEAAKAIIAEDAAAEPTPAPGDDSISRRELGGGNEPDESGRSEIQQGSKLCISCRQPMPREATTCPKCGWTQPPLVESPEG